MGILTDTYPQNNGQPQDWQLVGNPDPLCTYILDMRMIFGYDDDDGGADRDDSDNCHDHKRVDGVCLDQTALASKANMSIWLTLFSLGDTGKRGMGGQLFSNVLDKALKCICGEKLGGFVEDVLSHTRPTTTERVKQRGHYHKYNSLIYSPWI